MTNVIVCLGMTQDHLGISDNWAGLCEAKLEILDVFKISNNTRKIW